MAMSFALLDLLVYVLLYHLLPLSSPQLNAFPSLKEQYLLISDPKAIQYILQTSGYRYRRNWRERRIIGQFVVGRGILLAEGELSFFLF